VIVTQATRVGQLTFGDYLQRGMREAAMWALMCVALYLIISLISYTPLDPGWTHIGHAEQIRNAGGPFGAWFADVSLSLLGYFAYLIPVMVAWSAYLVFRRLDEEPETRVQMLALRWFGFFLTVGAGCAFVDVHFPALRGGLPNGGGGGLGQLIGGYLAGTFSPSGATLFLAALFLAGFSFFSGISWLTALDGLGWATLAVARAALGTVAGLRRPVEGGAAPAAEPAAPETAEGLQSGAGPMAGGLLEDAGGAVSEPASRGAATGSDPKRKPSGARAGRRSPRSRAGKAAEEEQLVLPIPGVRDQRPPLELLDEARKSGKGYSKELLEELSRQVELKLADFGVTVEVVAVHPGPVVTLFEMMPAPGTKASKITGLSRDIARALSTVSVRVVEVIPGKSVIGLEIPNETRETVFLREVLSSRPYTDAKSPLTLALGTNISGHPVVADLARMPHALIAGTTGSGKSVAINAMILSLLYKSSPRDVRLIMVDPKMLELSVYEGIPHLLTPVVTDMKEAANALRWCVAEMERRYRLMARLGVRNIAGFNRKVAEAEAAGEPIADPLFVTDQDLPEGVVPESPPPLSHLPYVVVIIDELADMMMVVGKKVEELIARLAQKARASGIHLLLATQRPSVDVLTGLIKANIPTRMAFQVSSRVDSRTVLDQMGAEHLLGNGDMLYLPPGTSIPHRVHGAFVDDHEVHHVVDFLREQGEPDYIDTILADAGEPIPGIDPEPRNGDLEDLDPLFDEAVQIVVESRRASISGVQRRLKIGYNRAARMIEEMERIGVVGPAESNGNREVLAPPPQD
jgi:S-DNA-T family DNA segregation ATPase FtsK/SpoIIIE